MIVAFLKKLSEFKKCKFKSNFSKFGNRLAVGPRPLKPLTGVRISVPEPKIKKPF